jgi:predicted SprT family Zn-dependent metalloprotease
MLNIELLQQLEEQIAKKQRRLPAQVIEKIFPNQEKTIASMYLKEEHKIIVNKEVFNKFNDIELIGMILHEGRHAYQWEQVKNPSDSEEDIFLIQQWKDEFSEHQHMSVEYLNEAYMTLAIEIDAIAYATLNIFNMTQLSLVIDPRIQALVDKRKQEIMGQKYNF